MTNEQAIQQLNDIIFCLEEFMSIENDDLQAWGWNWKLCAWPYRR